jgi:glycosyltransferase 2 family protein
MNRRFALIQALFSLVALGAVIWWASHQPAPELPSGAGAIAWLVAGLGLYVVATLVRAERWHRILHRTGVRSKRSDAYALTPVGYMGNNVLPARAGEMLRVVLLNKRAGVGKRTVIGTIVAERLLDAVALASIFVVVVFAVLHNLTLPHGRPFLLIAIAACVLLALTAAVWFLRRHHVVTRIREFMRPMAGGPRALVSFEGLFLLAVTFAVWALEASVYVAVARSLHIQLGAMDGLYLVALTNLFAMIPAAPGYVGTFDAAVVFGVKAVGGAGSTAVSYLLLLRFVLFVPITVVGLVVLVVRYGGWSRLRAAARLQASRA